MSDTETSAPTLSGDTVAEIFGPAVAAEAAEAGAATPTEDAGAEEGVPSEDAPKKVAKEVAADPAQERVAQRLAIARKKELHAAQVRADTNKAKAELDVYRAKIERLKSNPLDAIREMGMEPTEFLQRVVDDGQYSEKKEIESLRAEMAAFKQEREQLTQQYLQQQQQRHIEQVQAAFVTHIEESAEKYPHLIQEFEPDEIAARGLALAREYGDVYRKRTGEYPSDEVIAEYLEQQAAERAERKSERTARLLGKSKPKSSTSVVGTPVSKSPQGPRTLTNRDSSHRVTPSNRSMTQPERDEESLRILRQAGWK